MVLLYWRMLLHGARYQRLKALRVTFTAWRAYAARLHGAVTEASRTLRQRVLRRAFHSWWMVVTMLRNRCQTFAAKRQVSRTPNRVSPARMAQDVGADG